MAKKRIKRNDRYFNTYDLGGWMSGVNSKIDASKLGKAVGGSAGLGGIANAAASTVSGLINPSGNSTGVGNALQGIGSIASNIPSIGGVIGAGVNLVGGLVNAAFGSNLNEEFIAQTEDKTKQQAGYTSSAKDNASLLSDWASYTDMAHVKKKDVGSDGWFSNKAKNKTKQLNKAIDEANLRAWHSLSNTAGNVDTNNDFLAMANFSAYGGPIFSTSAIGYDLASRDLNNKQMKALGDMRLTSLPNSFNAMPEVNTINTFSKGGGIHIKKKNRGKFTDYCGGKVTSECIQRGLHSSNPTTRKRANFARNARKWHSFGGWLNSQGGDFTNGVTFIDNGGSHEANPFEGVQMGIDPQGVPNLVEEGEVIFNDYVFSDRMKLPKKLKEKYSIKGETFADAAKELSKESEERPNDPISQRGLEAFMSALAESQEEVRIKKQDRENNKMALGGLLSAAFGSNADNYRTAKGNLEFGMYGSPNPYAKGGKLGKRYEGDGPDDNYMDFGTLASPISYEQLERMMNLGVDGSAIPLTGTSEEIDDAITRAAADKGTLPTGNKSNLSYLRFAPALMSGISAFADIFSKPDYSAADRIASVDIQPALVSADPIGQYLSYRPLDRMFYINQLNKNAASGRRAIQNTTGGNRAAALAGILAADYNYGENLGQLARQAEEYNQALRERVAGFNRQTDMFNSQQSMQAQSVNAQSRNDATKMRLAQAEEVAKLRQAARNAYDARRSNNLNSFITNLGNIGWEDYQREWINSNPALYYNLSGIGSVGYKGNGKKNGGKLKKKRRNTYA